MILKITVAECDSPGLPRSTLRTCHNRRSAAYSTRSRILISNVDFDGAYVYALRFLQPRQATKNRSGNAHNCCRKAPYTLQIVVHTFSHLSFSRGWETLLRLAESPSFFFLSRASSKRCCCLFACAVPGTQCLYWLYCNHSHTMSTRSRAFKTFRDLNLPATGRTYPFNTQVVETLLWTEVVLVVVQH